MLLTCTMDWTYVTLAGALIWFGILFLPGRPWGVREVLEGEEPSADQDLSNVTVLIPARNEAPTISAVISALTAQGKNLSIVLIDDQSKDDTVPLARRAAEQNLRIVPGRPLPPGWTGKLWALEQGLAQVHTPLTLLLDADIELRPGLVAALRRKMGERGVHFISLMAALRMESFWERFFMPAFVYFFKLLYPFAVSNSPSPRVAAAAGGCILAETRVLQAIGAFRSLRGELIDDCALARRVKLQGGRTWIGLTHGVRSLRAYPDLASIWNMVARSAFAQLRYSLLLLLLCSGLMTAAFWLPVGGLFFPSPAAKAISAGAFAAMAASFLPTLDFYRRSRIFALALPLIGTFYLAMTWTSAVRFWMRRGAEWKGRSYLQGAPGD